MYYSNSIYKINYETGKAVDEYDQSSLVRSEPNLKADEVLNGIAYDKKNNIFLLTGKDWNSIYQVNL